jgi:glycosyltransferase involved in cell wall biosynthesis
MKVLFVTPSFYPATHYGGPTVVSRALCESMAEQQVEIQVLTTDANGPERIAAGAAKSGRKYSVVYCRRRFKPDIAPSLLWRLGAMIRRSDIVHLHGVYSFTTLPTLALCNLLRKPVVWSTHGALQRWEGSRRATGKQFWERICDLFCAANRVALHTTGAQEQIESQSRIRNVSEVVLPHGVEIPELNRASDSRTHQLRLLFLGRLHPIKGLENLLQALSIVNENATLAICGEGEPAYESHLRSLVGRLELEDRVRFLGRVDGPSREQQFQQADVCVVPSFKESFGAVIVESLARRVPVIAGRGTPWERLEEQDCGLWVANDPQELARAIDRISTMPLEEMGLRGRAWMEREFSWPQVARGMIGEYERLLQAPPGRRTDILHSAKAA